MLMSRLKTRRSCQAQNLIGRQGRPPRMLQQHKQHLQLSKQRHGIAALHQDVVSKQLGHEQCLQHAVHVAGVAEIVQADFAGRKAGANYGAGAVDPGLAGEALLVAARKLVGFEMPLQDCLDFREAG